MGLIDGLNSRKDGEVSDEHRFIPSAVEVLAPASTEPEPLPVDLRPPVTYSEALFISELRRLEKAVPFMLNHLLDIQGKDQLPRFIELSNSVHQLAILHQAKGVFDGE